MLVSVSLMITLFLWDVNADLSRKARRPRHQTTTEKSLSQVDKRISRCVICDKEVKYFGMKHPLEHGRIRWWRALRQEARSGRALGRSTYRLIVVRHEFLDRRTRSAAHCSAELVVAAELR